MIFPASFSRTAEKVALVLKATVDILGAAWGNRADFAVLGQDLVAVRRSPQTPQEFNTALPFKSIKGTLEALGFDLRQTKSQDFQDVIEYEGFNWNLHSQTVRITALGEAALLMGLNTWLSKAHRSGVSLQETRALCQNLHHYTFVFRSGRAYLPQLRAFEAAFQENDSTLGKPSSACISDIEHWRSWLQGHNPTPLYHSLKNFPPINQEVSMATSERDVRVVIDSLHHHWVLGDHVKIGALTGGDARVQFGALELTIRHFVSAGYSQAAITVAITSKVIAQVFAQGYSDDERLNQLYKHIMSVLEDSRLEMDVIAVEPDKSKAARGLAVHLTQVSSSRDPPQS